MISPAKCLNRCVILLAAAGLLSAAAAVNAGVLARGVARGISKKLTTPAPVGKPKDVIVSRARHPQAAAHIDSAQRTGQPTVLHVDRAGANARRSESIGSVNRKTRPQAGFDRDEYPPAFTREGGSGSSVRFIGAHDNRGVGAAMRAQTRELKDGDKIRVIVSD